MVGTRSAQELAALGPGTMLCDGNAYIFTFLAAASEYGADGLHCLSMLLSKADTPALLHSVRSPGIWPIWSHSLPATPVQLLMLQVPVYIIACAARKTLQSVFLLG